MESKQLLGKKWFSIILSVLVTLILFLILPDFFPKYKLEILEKIKSSHKQDYYHDLDNDGLSEYITLYNDQFGISALVVYRHFESYSTNSPYFQTNLKRVFISKPTMQFIDYDGDGIDELFFFTRKGDSLYLEWNHYKSPTVHSKFVGRVCINERGEDYEVFFGDKVDLNNDGYKEILFAVSGANCGICRYLVAYDIFNDTIYRSPKSYINFRSKPSIFSDKKKNVFITVPTGATNNYQKPSNYLTDSASYLIVFDNHLNYVFDPIPSHGYTSFTIPYFVSKNEQNLIFCRRSFKNDDVLEYHVELYDLHGSLKVSMHVKEDLFGYGNFVTRYNNQDHLFTMQNNQFINEYDFSLNLLRTFDFEGNCGIHQVLDIDNDNETEVIFFNLDTEKLIISRADISNIVEIHFPYTKPYHISLKQNNNGHNLLAIDASRYLVLVDYYKNPVYFLKLPFYMGISLFFYFLIFIYRKLISEGRLRKEKELAGIQLKSLKNQLDPHFTLNVLNSISGMYNSQRMEEADKYLNRFSKLMHQSLENSNEVALSLEKELQFTREFMEVQKARFENCFTYQITVEDEVNLALKVPRMLIHTFVENAIKHGLLPRKREGVLIIDIKSSDNTLYITISDNGVGRDRAQVLETKGTGRGLEIVDQSLELYKKLTGIRIRYNISDAMNGDLTGTIVEIKLPKINI